jgi:hypothetical protein
MKGGAFKVHGGIINGVATATVGYGTVNGFEPRVSGKRISGLNSEGRMDEIPVITGSELYDEYGRLYVCIRVKIDFETGKMVLPPNDDTLTVVISRHTRLAAEINEGLDEKVYWNHPIAVFGDAGHFGQIAYFNLMHYTSRKSVGRVWHHYFSPA